MADYPVFNSASSHHYDISQAYYSLPCSVYHSSVLYICNIHTPQA